MRSQTAGALSPPQPTYLGTLGLSKLRQRSGVTLEHIADKTKISIRFLRAIEAEDFEKLPGGLFNTSYIRQYAAEIGFDEDRLLTQYKDKTAQPEEEPLRLRGKPARPETRSWFNRWFGLAVTEPRT